MYDSVRAWRVKLALESIETMAHALRAPRPDGCEECERTARYLRNADCLRFALHLVEHGCAERGGFGHCDEAMALFNRMPAEFTVIMAAAYGEALPHYV